MFFRVVLTLAHPYRRGMHIGTQDLPRISGQFETLKKGDVDGVPAQRQPQVIETVSGMLADIENNGMDAVLRFSRDLDGWTGNDPEVSAEDLARTGDQLSPELRTAL